MRGPRAEGSILSSRPHDQRFPVTASQSWRPQSLGRRHMGLVHGAPGTCDTLPQEPLRPHVQPPANPVLDSDLPLHPPASGDVAGAVSTWGSEEAPAVCPRWQRSWRRDVLCVQTPPLSVKALPYPGLREALAGTEGGDGSRSDLLGCRLCVDVLGTHT